MPARAPGMASPIAILFAVVSPSLSLLFWLAVPLLLGPLLIDTPPSPTVTVEVGLETTTSRFLVGLFSVVVGAGTRGARIWSLLTIKKKKG